MRITRTTSVPVSANDRTAAGPAALMTTPLPTKSPAPITPPSAIICMCRLCRVRCSPLDSTSADGPGPAAIFPEVLTQV